MTATTTPVHAAAMQQSSPERGAEVLLDQVGAFVAELRELSADEWASPPTARPGTCGRSPRTSPARWTRAPTCGS